MVSETHFFQFQLVQVLFFEQEYYIFNSEDVSSDSDSDKPLLLSPVRDSIVFCLNDQGLLLCSI